ncbi:MAG: hypothetical protein DPW11_01245 [bacterium]|nr:hypothetical protein [Candidatus Microgenomates bacterium CPR3]MCQ3944388.1 hypothetical protein [bacterium]RIK51313.1 MAG: hypothetical protein DCC61_03030 [Candidatus Microgenomates bacterium]
MGVVTRQILNALNDPEYANANIDVRRVVAKDVLISYVLSFIYNRKKYASLVFYGGTCAKVVYGLDRFSEDIDLDNSMGVGVASFGDELAQYCKNKMQIEGADVYEQSGEGGIRRFVLRVPIMNEIGLSPRMSEKLHVKVEMSNMTKHATVQKTPLVRHGQAMVIQHFDLPSLMAGKMVACLERNWRKGEVAGTDIKGRDFYDLIWYMNKGVRPNPEVLKHGGEQSYTLDSTWKLLEKKVLKINKNELKFDLKSFVPNGVYLDNWLDNFQDYFSRLRKSA